MPRNLAKIAPLAAANGQVLAHRQLIECGLTDADIQKDLREGRLVRLGYDAYIPIQTWREAQSNPAHRAALGVAAARAAARINPGVASHETAAVIHGLDLLDAPGPDVVVTRCAGRARTRNGARIHVGELPPHHVTTAFGVPLTTVARTVIDLSLTMDFASALVVADSALRRVPEFDLLEVLGDLRHWPTVSLAHRVVDHADRKSESAFESLSRARIIDSDLPKPELQRWLWDLKPPRRLDFVWPGTRVAAEPDGLAKYKDDPWRIADEKIRDEQLREAGYEVVHYIWREMRYTPEVVIRRILKAFHRTRRLGYWR